jgi:hypothetical protein
LERGCLTMTTRPKAGRMDPKAFDFILFFHSQLVITLATIPSIMVLPLPPGFCYPNSNIQCLTPAAKQNCSAHRLNQKDQS